MIKLSLNSLLKTCYDCFHLVQCLFTSVQTCKCLASVNLYSIIIEVLGEIEGSKQSQCVRLIEQ